MKEKLEGFWESLKALWDRLSRVARIVLLSSIVFLIAIIIVLTVLMNQTEYALLANDLSQTESMKLYTVLSEQGIDYHVEPSGAVTVAEKDLANARMQMISAGIMGSVVEEDGYSPGLTDTQQDKNYKQNVELQKKVKASIEAYDEIKQAIVIIQQSEKSTFALKTDIVPPSAAITIERRAGRELTSEKLRGIINIVKTSVPGISEENISLTDTEYGDLKGTLDLGLDVSSNKLRLQEEVAETLRQKAMTVVSPMFGDQKVRIAIYPELDTNKSVIERKTYDPLDPDNPQNNPYDYSEHYQEYLGPDAAPAEGVPGANDNVQTPQYGEQQGVPDDAESYASNNIYDYLVGSTVEQITKDGMEIVGASASVLIDATTLPDGQRDHIIALVSNATGIAIERITVQNYAFAQGPEVDEPAFLPESLSPMQILLLVAIALVVLVILIVVIIVIVTKKKKPEEEEQSDLLYDEEGNPLLAAFNTEEDFEPITLVETQEQKLKAQIKDLADSDPEIVASLLKTWISATP